MAKQNVGDVIGILFYARDTAHIAHLASKSFSEHMALDDFYKGIVGLADTLCETYQGCYGLVEIKVPESKRVPALPFLRNLKAMIERERKGWFDETFLQNILDEIQQLVATTIYKLENLK